LFQVNPKHLGEEDARMGKHALKSRLALDTGYTADNGDTSGIAVPLRNGGRCGAFVGVGLQANEHEAIAIAKHCGC
jgi:hypothetical protein